MTRKTVKLLLVDADQRLLLVRARDTATDLYHWYPVGGGIESDESLDQAASREAWEETGLTGLTNGTPVWIRRAVYTYSGRTVDVHETWLHYPVDHFEPAPAMLTADEKESIVDFRWWTSAELQATQESVFPPDLGDHLAQLQNNGHPTTPINIGVRQPGPGHSPIRTFQRHTRRPPSSRHPVPPEASSVHRNGAKSDRPTGARWG